MKEKNKEVFEFRGEAVKLHRYVTEEGLRCFETSDGKLWLYVEDVLKELELKIEDVKTEITEKLEILSSGCSIIPEGTLYKLILRKSETGASKNFLEWISYEVLPELSQRGIYKVQVSE